LLTVSGLVAINWGDRNKGLFMSVLSICNFVEKELYKSHLHTGEIPSSADYGEISIHASQFFKLPFT